MVDFIIILLIFTGVWIRRNYTMHTCILFFVADHAHVCGNICAPCAGRQHYVHPCPCACVYVRKSQRVRGITISSGAHARAFGASRSLVCWRRRGRGQTSARARCGGRPRRQNVLERISHDAHAYANRSIGWSRCQSEKWYCGNVYTACE